jgi:hypothetical protein
MNSTISRINRLRRNLPTAVASLVILSSLLLSVSLANAQSSDFAVNANPVYLCVNPGINAQSLVTVSSIGGFAGTVNLSDSVSPSSNNAPTLSSIPSSVTVSSAQPADFTLGMSTTTSTPVYTYTITVSGISGESYHTATIYLTVSADCSVGGVIVSTTHGTMGYSLVMGIAIAGIIGLVAASLVVYVSRRKNQPID